MMCSAISPAIGPPHALRSALRSVTQFIARRTCTSSNGGWVRFIVMKYVWSAEFDLMYFRLLASVEYSRKTLRRRRCVLVLELARRDLVVDVVEVGVDRELEAVRIVLASLRAVRPRVVVGIADEDETRLAVVPADRLHGVARLDVQVLRAFDHVRPGRDHEATVFTRLPLEAVGHLVRDRACSRHAQALREVACWLREIEHDRPGVRRPDA